jgi:5-(carboxyamino)imidazole ribonucleotide mutase
MSKVVIIMGSKDDMEHCQKIAETLRELGVEYVLRVASAHKTPLKALEIIKEYDEGNLVFITVAGRSNALSGFVDANTIKPVIACPPYSDRFSGADIFSSLRMPSGVSPLVVLEPEQAALAAVKILALSDKNLEGRMREYQEGKRRELERADEEVLKL